MTKAEEDKNLHEDQGVDPTPKSNYNLIRTALRRINKVENLVNITFRRRVDELSKKINEVVKSGRKTE